MEITKEEVLKALELIENYKNQELNKVKAVSISLDEDILNFDFPARVLNVFRWQKIRTLNDLLNCGKGEMIKRRGIGKVNIIKINQELQKLGYGENYFRKS